MQAGQRSVLASFGCIALSRATVGRRSPRLLRRCVRSRFGSGAASARRGSAVSGLSQVIPPDVLRAQRRWHDLNPRSGRTVRLYRRDTEHRMAPGSARRGRRSLRIDWRQHTSAQREQRPSSETNLPIVLGVDWILSENDPSLRTYLAVACDNFGHSGEGPGTIMGVNRQPNYIVVSVAWPSTGTIGLPPPD